MCVSNKKEMYYTKYIRVYNDKIFIETKDGHKEIPINDFFEISEVDQLTGIKKVIDYD